MQNKNTENTTSLIEDHFYALSVDETLERLKSSKNGLSENEAKLRLKQYGHNQLIVAKPQSIFVRFFRQFHNILIYILLVSALIALFMHRLVDMSVILGVIILNALVGFIQEGKAEKALSAIRDILAPTAQVIRDGKKQTVLAINLVPGDIVMLQGGDKVPSDVRLIETRGLLIQESILTGEAHAVEKTISSVDVNTPLAERISLAFSGTIITKGVGTGVVIATGLNTEIGKISEILSEVETPTTPLLLQMNKFGYWITAGTVLLGIITFLVGVVIWGDSSEEMLMAIVGLIVAAVPEGLPPILTIILAIGVTEMAKRCAIIRRLPAVETMGAVTTICTDKTGTLTCNELIVQHLITAKHEYKINGDVIYFGTTADAAETKIADFKDNPDLKTTLLAAILCNDAEFNYVGDQQEIYGDPLDKALLTLGHKAKLDLHFQKQAYPRTDLIPYESEHRFMATLHHDHAAGKSFIYIKGAAEQILAICKDQRLNGEVEALDSTYWQGQINTLANNGEKVLAIAYKEVEHSKQTLRFDDINQLTMIGLFGFIDPPREEAKQSVAECQAAGIRVKMITGDHAITAKAIAATVGINCAQVLSGNEIDAMDDITLAQKAVEVDVYARATPAHKLRLVKALQASDQVVAMTGDGVNDAPALRQADIGIAMGQKGTEIAKEASSIVLTDDNFATIDHAVEEGRTIYENLKKTIMYVLPTSIAQAFVIVVAIFLGWQTPITAVQILWVNMVTAVTLSLALGFEPPMSDVMLHPPRPKHEAILSPFLIWRVVFVSAILVIAVFILSLIERSLGFGLITNRTVAVNVIVFGEIFYLINCRRIYASALNIDAIFGSKPALIAIAAVVILQMLFTYVPIMQHFFGTESIGVTQWLRIIAFSLAVFFVIEGEKLLVRMWRKQ